MDQLSLTFAALADPTRRAILARLAQGEASVTELAAPFAISLPAVSKHLRVLSEANLIERRVNARWRMVTLKAEPLRDAEAWIDAYRHFWEHSLDRLATFLEQPNDEEPS
jgi:DNA-binding transcriptional ArsR family regulator